MYSVKNHDDELNLSKWLLISLSAYQFILSLLVLVNDYIFLSFVCFALLIFYFFLFLLIKLNKFILMINCVMFSLLIYSAIMLWVFGWGYGFEFFIFPFIAYSYIMVGNKTFFVFPLALFAFVSFEVMMYCFSVKNYSIGGDLELFDVNLELFLRLIHAVGIGTAFILISNNLRLKILSEIKTMENINANLSKNANLDYLTGLKNRWYFSEKIQDFRIGNKINFALIDIDNFKSINDFYGYGAGDKVLFVCSNLIHKHFGELTELICRWDSEEFLLFSVGIDFADFQKLCEQLKDDFNAYNFAMSDLSATISIGHLNIEQNFTNSNFDEYVKILSNCIFNAKENGGNKIVHYTI